jgi:FkbM family methyltransferase
MRIGADKEMDERQEDTEKQEATGPKGFKAAVADMIIKAYRLLPLKLRQRIHDSRLADIPRSFTRRLIGDVGPAQYVIQSGPMKGKIIHTDLKSWSGYYLGTYEPELVSTLERHVSEGMTVLDVGANHGYFTLLFSQLVGPRGKVYAFEPEPVNYQLLEKTIAANGLSNVEAVKLAVSSRSGVEKLFLEDAYLGTHSMEKKDSDNYIEVNLTSVDEFARERRLPSVDFVKIDIEGHEVEALKGMAETMRRWKPSIVCEFQDQRLLSQGSEILRDNGYTLETIREHYETQVFARAGE